MSDKTTLTAEELAMIASAALKVAAERDALRAENERLRAAAQAVIDSINDENEIDPDAIARLSAALSDICRA